MQGCSCGRDSIATCRNCGRRVCGTCYIGDPYYLQGAGYWFEYSKGRVIAKSFAPMPLSITSARETYTAHDAFEHGWAGIICGICRFSAAAQAVSSLREIPVPHEFGSLSEAASDIIEGRWPPRADLQRPATAQEIDDAIRWHTRNRAAEDVHDSWRSKKHLSNRMGDVTFQEVDVTYRKGWRIGSTPDSWAWDREYEEPEFKSFGNVFVDQRRQFHICGRTSSLAMRWVSLCDRYDSGWWFTRRTHSRWSPQPPTLLLGEITERILSIHPDFGYRGGAGLIPTAGSNYWYQPLPQ